MARLSAAATALLLVHAGCDQDSTVSSPTTEVPFPPDCDAGAIVSADGSCVPVGPGESRCEPGEVELEDGTCQPAGLPPDMTCPPGELSTADGCRAAGIHPADCGDGFEADGTGACAPVLPQTPCATGEMATPGESTCRAVAPCGSGDYGDAPVGPTTQFVNASYGGGDSNGTSDKPWSTIQQGVDAAASGAVVAIAAGTYAETIIIQGKAVRLWGRCPGMVRVAAPPGSDASLYVWSGADGTEIHGVAVTGPGFGLSVSDAAQVVLDHLWLHDNGSAGLLVSTSGGPASVTLRDSLLEGNRGYATYAYGAALAIEGTVLRDTLAHPEGYASAGILAWSDDDGQPATLSLRGSLVERNYQVGVFVVGSTATVEDSVVRDGVADPDGHAEGVDVGRYGPIAGSLAMRRSVIDNASNIGLCLRGSEVTVEHTTIANTRPRPGGGGGHGVNIQPDDEEGQRASLTLKQSLVQRAHAIGIFVGDSDALIEGTAIRDTQTNAKGHGVAVQLEALSAAERPTATIEGSVLDGSWGYGLYARGADLVIDASIVRGTTAEEPYVGTAVHVSYDALWDAAGTLTLSQSVVEGNAGQGIFLSGATALITDSEVRDTATNGLGEFGRGIAVADHVEGGMRSSVTIRGVLLERNRDVSIIVGGSDAVIESVRVRDTEQAQGDFGAGIVVQAREESGQPASATIRATAIDHSRAAGLLVYGASTVVERSSVTDTLAAANGMFGDGVIVVSSPTHAGGVEISSTAIERAARAGVCSHSAQVSLSDSLLLCHAFELDGEIYDAPFTFIDLGGNGCGCPEATRGCQVVSSQLTPPGPLADPPETPDPDSA